MFDILFYLLNKKWTLIFFLAIVLSFIVGTIFYAVFQKNISVALIFGVFVTLVYGAFDSAKKGKEK